MDKNTNYLSKTWSRSINVIALTCLCVSTHAFSHEETKKPEEHKQNQTKLKMSWGKKKPHYHKVEISEDKKSFIIAGFENQQAQPITDEEFYIKHKRHHAKKTKNNNENHDIKFSSSNKRDGFYLAYSAVSSQGDDLYQTQGGEDTNDFEIHSSYRIQGLGLFIESPGLNSRRMHGLYATRAWGINFYNGKDWSFDLYKQRDTKTVKGLSGIQNRNKYKRAGIRATGYFDNSQVQVIFSPYSTNNSGSDGIEASMSYTRYWQVKNWNLYGSLGVQYQSKEVESYYPENWLFSSETNDSRINSSAELGLEYALNKDWVLGGFISHNKLPSRDENASQEKDLSGTRSGILLTYVF